jgi:hypothetical protein
MCNLLTILNFYNTAAFIEAIILQPTLYWKNAKAQQLPFTLNVRTLYRGTGAAILGECQQMGLQFLFTGMSKKYLMGSDDSAHGEVSISTQFISAATGGLFSSFFTAPVEGVMIQQQKFGGSLFGTFKSTAANHGFFQGGLMRGLTGAALRDTIYVTGMLGVTPIVRDYLIEEHQVAAPLAGLYASLMGGVVAAVPSHPVDVIKTCMQVGNHLLHYL